MRCVTSRPAKGAGRNRSQGRHGRQKRGRERPTFPAVGFPAGRGFRARVDQAGLGRRSRRSKLSGRGHWRNPCMSQTFFSSSQNPPGSLLRHPGQLNGCGCRFEHRVCRQPPRAENNSRKSSPKCNAELEMFASDACRVLCTSGRRPVASASLFVHRSCPVQGSRHGHRIGCLESRKCHALSALQWLLVHVKACYGCISQCCINQTSRIRRRCAVRCVGTSRGLPGMKMLNSMRVVSGSDDSCSGGYDPSRLVSAAVRHALQCRRPGECCAGRWNGSDGSGPLV
jgi:hypothetical protein